MPDSWPSVNKNKSAHWLDLINRSNGYWYSSKKLAEASKIKVGEIKPPALFVPG